MKLWQLLLCATMVACSGDDDGPKPAADAGDGGPDSGLDGGDTCVGDACAPVGPKPLGEERLFEPNASVLGRVVSASGAPLTGYAVQVFDIPSTGAARGDVSFAPAFDGSFRWAWNLGFKRGLAAVLTLSCLGARFPFIRRRGDVDYSV